jgi:hypothetical protein
MIALLYLAAASKLRSGFSVPCWIQCRKLGCRFFTYFWNLVLEHTIFSKNNFLQTTRKSTFQSTKFNWVLTCATLFHGNNRKRKSSSRKKYQIYKVLIFFVSRIICLVFLIEILELKFRYGFVENFTVLLLKTEFVLGNLRNRSYRKNIETGFTVNFYFLWSIFLSL